MGTDWMTYVGLSVSLILTLSSSILMFVKGNIGGLLEYSLMLGGFLFFIPFGLLFMLEIYGFGKPSTPGQSSENDQ